MSRCGQLNHHPMLCNATQLWAECVLEWPRKVKLQSEMARWDLAASQKPSVGSCTCSAIFILSELWPPGTKNNSDVGRVELAGASKEPEWYGKSRIATASTRAETLKLQLPGCKKAANKHALLNTRLAIIKATYCQIGV